MADAEGLNPSGGKPPCGFESRPGHVEKALGDARVASGHPSQDRVRTARPFNDRCHTRHVFSRRAVPRRRRSGNSRRLHFRMHSMTHSRWAVLDEAVSRPVRGDVVYTIAAAVVIERSRDEVRGAVLDALNRQRPFHWVSDRGPVKRQRMIDCLIGLEVQCVGTHSDHVSVSDQEHVRRDLLTSTLLPELRAAGVDSLILEGRSNKDRYDKATFARFRADSNDVRWSYTWADKSEPLLWLADAAAGALFEYVAKGNDRWWSQLDVAGLAVLKSEGPDG